MDGAGEAPLGTRLREANSEQLLRLLERHLGELDVPAARLALRNPFLTSEAVRVIAQAPHLIRVYELQRDLALHPRTTEVVALRFVAHLRWRDLVRLGANAQSSPGTRRAADQTLITRLSSLSLGEKIALARLAGSGVLAQLRFDRDPRVFRALLDNPRVTEGVLAPVVGSESTPASLLEAIADSPRYGVRPEVRLQLCRNRSFPLERALRLLGGLPKQALRDLSIDRRVREAIRRRAGELAGVRPGTGT